MGNHMFFASSYGEIIALNATTGAEEWKFKLPDNDAPSARGLAFWPDAKGYPATLVFGSRLGRLYSLDAKTGKLSDGFGDHGVVNLKAPEVMVTGMQAVYDQPSPPVIYKDLIITGAGTPMQSPTGARAAIPALGMRAPANWSGPSTPYRYPAPSALIAGTATACATVRASISWVI